MYSELLRRQAVVTLQIWIGALLIAESSGRAVTGKDDGVVLHLRCCATERVVHRSRVAVREISAADAAHEDEISNKRTRAIARRR